MLRRRAVVAAGAAVAALILLAVAVAMSRAAQEQQRNATLHRDNAERAKREAFRQLGHVDWMFGARARENETDLLRPGHFFLQGAQAFQFAGESAQARNATLAATLADRALLCTFPDGGAGAVFNRDESRILTWSSDGAARLWAVGQKEPIQIFAPGDGNVYVPGVMDIRQNSSHP
jgi:hypothetical protein